MSATIASSEPATIWASSTAKLLPECTSIPSSRSALGQDLPRRRPRRTTGSCARRRVLAHVRRGTTMLVPVCASVGSVPETSGARAARAARRRRGRASSRSRSARAPGPAEASSTWRDRDGDGRLPLGREGQRGWAALAGDGGSTIASVGAPFGSGIAAAATRPPPTQRPTATPPPRGVRCDGLRRRRRCRATSARRVELVGVQQHGARLRALRGSDRALDLEEVHEPTRARKPTRSLRCSIDVEPSWLRTTSRAPGAGARRRPRHRSAPAAATCAPRSWATTGSLDLALAAPRGTTARTSSSETQGDWMRRVTLELP